MSTEDIRAKKTDSEGDTELERSEFSEHDLENYGEGQALEDERGVQSDEVYPGEIEEKWVDLGEYGEGGRFIIYAGEAAEYPPAFGEVESEAESIVASEVEETEEEKEMKRHRELLVEDIRRKIMNRLLLRRRNIFLQKKILEYFKKRRLNNAFKEDPKGLDLDSKYLKRLYAFQEFKKVQEDEIEEMTIEMDQYKTDTDLLAEEYEEKLKNFILRAKEISLNLILSKTGKRINEKLVDSLLKRKIKKSEEKGEKMLTYVKIKKTIEEKESQLKAMEYFGNGLHIADYEQLKIDNQNYTDKIEEKEEELNKYKTKTQSIMLNLANVKEKEFAIEEDIELMEERVFEVEKKFEETRENLTKARKRRDNLREELSRLKSVSGLLTKDALLRDFEESIHAVKNLTKTAGKMKKVLIKQRKKEEYDLSLERSSSTNDWKFETQKL